MPGLSQLKNFVNDITALGDEVAVRTARGETVEEVVAVQQLHRAASRQQRERPVDRLLVVPPRADEVGAPPVRHRRVGRRDAHVPRRGVVDRELVQTKAA